jgi:RNA polymerase sigma-70 factor, ECF subfamily
VRTAARDEGSAEAFRRLYELSAAALLGAALRVLGRRELAEEALHDAFTRIWHSAAGFDPLAARPIAWMVAIARNRALDLRASHAVSNTDPLEDVDSVMGDSDTRDPVEIRRLRDCLGRLEAPQRQAIVLAYDRGLSHSELAAHLGKPLGTVKAWVRRGLASLRLCLEGVHANR